MMMKSTNDHTEDMVDRLAKIEFANPNCADCPAASPRWASFQRVRETAEEDAATGSNNSASTSLQERYLLSVMVCDDCAIRHHCVLGEKRCMIKCLECFHEWTHQEADVVLASGNTLVNRLYESKLKEAEGEDFFDKELVLEEDREVEDARRSQFIRNKYKKRKYRDDAALASWQRRMSTDTKVTAKVGNLSSFNFKRRKPNKKSSFLLSPLLLRSSDKNNNLKSPSFHSSRGSRVSRATKAMTAFSGNFKKKKDAVAATDRIPQRPERCPSEASYQSKASYQTSVSSLTYSGRHSYFSSTGSSETATDLGSWSWRLEDDDSSEIGVERLSCFEEIRSSRLYP